MYPESKIIKVNKKLDELKLIIKQVFTSNSSAIDLDLAKQKCRELYDQLLLLEKTDYLSDDTFDSIKNEKIEENRDEEINPQSEINDPIIASDPEPQEEDDNKIDTHFEIQPVLQDRDIIKNKKSDDESEQPLDKKKVHDIEIMADRYQNSQKHINQALADKISTSDLSAKIQSKPITDIRGSIGINEKFLFIKELFGSSADLYNQCIENLNSSSSYDEAVNYLQTNFNWEEGNPLVEKLLTLVRRKHHTGI